MAPLPRIQPSTIRAIYQAYKDSNETWDSWGISVGELGTECDRALWYSFRWASQPEDIDGQKVRIFRRGDIEEERLVADLERIGVEVFGQQDRIRLVSGHVRGKIDGRCIGLREAPKTEHLCEFKSSNTKNFAILVKKKCKEGKPLHYVQCQLGMHAFGLTRALYLVCNKDNEELYAERIEYDAAFCLREIARAERIINSAEPPSRITEKEGDFRCLFCKHKSVCFEGAWARVTCRSCLHSTPEMGGDAHWSCARWIKPISIDEQREACSAHLYIPQTVPGVLVDSDEENETVTYTLRDGSTWVDGAAREDVTVVPANDNEPAAESEAA
jgi:ribosomal protein S27E